MEGRKSDERKHSESEAKTLNIISDLCQSIIGNVINQSEDQPDRNQDSADEKNGDSNFCVSLEQSQLFKSIMISENKDEILSSPNAEENRDKRPGGPDEDAEIALACQDTIDRLIETSVISESDQAAELMKIFQTGQSGSTTDDQSINSDSSTTYCSEFKLAVDADEDFDNRSSTLSDSPENNKCSDSKLVLPEIVVKVEKLKWPRRKRKLPKPKTQENEDDDEEDNMTLAQFQKCSKKEKPLESDPIDEGTPIVTLSVQPSTDRLKGPLCRQCGSVSSSTHDQEGQCRYQCFKESCLQYFPEDIIPPCCVSRKLKPALEQPAKMMDETCDLPAD